MSLISYASSTLKALSFSLNRDPVSAEDFSKFHGGTPEGKTGMTLSRTRSELILEIMCHEPAEIHDQNKQDDWTIFTSGDRLEIFFGAREPEPWLSQFVVGAGGGKSDNKGTKESWKAEVETGKHYWKARLVFPFNMFRMNNLSMFFNVCRYSEARNEYVTWADLAKSFHEVENYGLLLLDDYSKIYFAETGNFPEQEFSRQDFETAMEQLRIPAHQIQHGPWITNPAENSMTVSFGSAGKCGAFLEYRKNGSETWNRLPFDHRNGILIRKNRIHILHLQGLNPGTVYQYRIITLHPITLQESVSKVYQFKTFDQQEKEFEFTVFSDIHSDIENLRNLLKLKELNESKFLLNLGDYLSCACGEESYYRGFLDLESNWCMKSGKPLIFCRGNHEQIGTDAGLYQELLPRPDGKSYFTFQQGDTFFIALDAGNDKPDDETGLFRNDAMIREEREWLKKVTQSREYTSARWRIILIHMPPCIKGKYDSDAAYSLVRICTEHSVKPDLILSGHLHKYLKIEPEQGICSYLREGKTTPITLPLSCPLMANDTDTMIQVAVHKDSLSARCMDSAGTMTDEVMLRKNK